MRWLLSWIVFIMGDLVSRPMSRWDCMSWLYPAYNWLMLKSVDIQGEGKGPWYGADGDKL